MVDRELQSVVGTVERNLIARLVVVTHITLRWAKQTRLMLEAITLAKT